MIRRYLKGTLITLAMILIAWGNTYVLYAHNKRVDALVSEVYELSQELEDSRSKEAETLELLQETQDNLRELISRKEEEAKALARAEANKQRSLSATVVPIIKPVIPAPQVVKPEVVKVVKPSRSTRAS